MENELRNEINRLREQLRTARTVHVVVGSQSLDGEFVSYKNLAPAIFSSATDAELFCAEQREKYSGFFSVRTIEVK